MARRNRLSHYAALGFWLWVFLAVGADVILHHSPNELPRSVQLLLFQGPLLLTFPGLLRNSVRSHLFTAVIALLYFSAAIVKLTSASPLAWPLLIGSVGLFISSLLFTRWQAQKEATQDQTAR